MNKLSHSSVRMYSECSRKYKLHYVDRLRSKTIGGALLFGSAVDNGLNHLLKTKNVEESIAAFEKTWNLQYVNDSLISLSKSTIVVYAEKDFDIELLQKEDHKLFKEYKEKLNLFPFEDTSGCMEELKTKKKENGLNSLSEEEKKLLSYGNWLCLKNKGHIMIRSYNEKVMPQIEEVIEIQKKFEIKNKDQDSIIGICDLIVKMKDGKVYIMDNKTSTRQYNYDSAKRSPQLILYYHAFKKKYVVDGVGFNVMYKTILKNRTKVCSVCGYVAEKGARAVTCTNTTANGKRCSEKWNEAISPECDIDVILNQVAQAAEQLVMESFDESNSGIHKGVFRPNLLACGDTNSDYRCQFYNRCWNNTSDDLINLPERKKDIDNGSKT